MATITLRGEETHTAGELPKIGSRVPEFTLTDSGLTDVSMNKWHGRRRLLNIFPSIDTPVCAESTRKFNEFASKNPDVAMIMISADLPFAHKRFCSDESLENVVTLSTMRSRDFARDYGVLIEDGPLAGLAARAVLVVDENDVVVHAELVSEIGNEPDYESALRALGA
ncbi:MAG: thiol peroxidase [Gammaproteobacteria bacterium]|nr:thiol peroxidase [Gammaproteobacteria bacterium]